MKKVAIPFRFCLPNRCGVLCVCCLFFQGCLLVPVADSVSQIGLSEGDRVALLETQVRKYREALYWGKNQELHALVASENREAVVKGFRTLSKDRKIVETKVHDSSFTNDSYEAVVFLGVKSYDPKTLVITEREEKQKWVFHLSDGWKLVSRDFN